MHPNHLKKTIQRTLKQIGKQKLKQAHSKADGDRQEAVDRLKQLRAKLAMLQEISNRA